MAISALKKGMEYFGLSYDGQTELENNVVEQTYEPAPAPHYATVAPAAQVAEPYVAEVTPIGQARGYQPVPADGELRRITTIKPSSYNDARLIGEAFRSGTPVIVNLSEMSDEDAKRLVDFSSGIIFGLYGSLEKVTNKVFLLSPHTVEVVGEEEIEASESHGGQFYNQS